MRKVIQTGGKGHVDVDIDVDIAIDVDRVRGERDVKVTEQNTNNMETPCASENIRETFLKVRSDCGYDVTDVSLQM